MSTIQNRTAASRLRERLSGPELLIVPGAGNAHHARLAEQAGFEAVFSTGAGIANTFLGMPDLGLMTATESLWVTRNIVSAVDIPIIADADNGYGNLNNAARSARDLDAAGVAAIVVEDQVFPKRCGHFDGKQIVAQGEMVEKLLAVKEVLKSSDTVLVARTDAIACTGFEDALVRAHAYAAAGADVIFVEAPRSVEQMRQIPAEIELPCLINIVEGGLTPNLPAQQLQEFGFKIALYANLALRAGARAVTQVLTSLREHGDSLAVQDTIQTFDERQGSVGLPDWKEFEARILARAKAQSS